MPTQSEMRFTLEPAGGVAFDVIEFDFLEELSRPFVLTLDLSSTDTAIDFGQILDQPALFTIWRGGQPVRYVHGLVSAFEQGETGFRRSRYRATIEPTLARAALCSDWRVFQLQTVPQILQTVLKTHGIIDYEQILTREHLPREYCVQPGETDLDFLARLAAEEGFYYAFAHGARGHRLIHGDRIYVHGVIDGGPVIYHPTPGGDPAEPCLRTFRYTEQVRTARTVQRDYSFKHPRYDQQQTSDGRHLDHQGRDYENYHFPGRYKTDAAGKPFTATRLSSLRRDAQTAEVEGDDARLVPGLAFDLVGHPREEWNRGWRPVRVHHHGVQHTSQQEESADATRGTHYGYTATLIPDRVDWKAPLLPKPRIDGPQMATVVGPPGEEIYCDEYGRVIVQFPWDREGENNEHSSCWIRVAQNWAGATWGHMAIPRIGQEVIVSYVDGVRGLLRIPDVVRLHSFTSPSDAQYSQGNLACVIEMKFPGDGLSEKQQQAYQAIAGDDDRFRLLYTSHCETADKRLRRGWMRAAQKEPVYKPVGKAMSLPTRAMADPYALLVGLIDAEHDLARRQLEVKPPPPGTPMMSASPDPAEAEARQRQGMAQIEMTLAAPFVAVGAAMLTMAAAPLAVGAGTTEETTITAQAGAKVIQFERYQRVARAAGAAGTAAGVVEKLAAQPIDVPRANGPALSPEQQRQWDAYCAWEAQQRYQPTDEKHYLFWPDAPRNMP